MTICQFVKESKDVATTMNNVYDEELQDDLFVEYQRVINVF